MDSVSSFKKNEELLMCDIDYMLCCIMYYVDICTLFGLVRLFYEMLKEKRIVEEFILSHYNLDVNELQRFIK